MEVLTRHIRIRFADSEVGKLAKLAEPPFTNVPKTV